ncbi:MAG: DNA repair protein RecN [Treponema sp.]|jgi:DNA repair protein RecN (Recombination protein N)|nr:DNA repair protein RecN [Treponema sp.]
MLEELTVRNYALIESLSLSFEGGFNVLTGETGAGKSIIVGSLSFLLGTKADTEVIRTGCDEAGVSAVVSIPRKNKDAEGWLQARDIRTDEGRIIIRRSIKSSGRSSIYIQNVPVTRNDLAEFMALLVDLHGQHTHESLLKKETHRKYLDHFGGLEEEAAGFNRLFLDLAERRKALEGSVNSERDRGARLELLSYAVEEIARAAPKSGESRELENEAARLEDFEKLADHANAVVSSFIDDDPSVVSLTRRVRSFLENAAGIDKALAPLLKRMEDLYYEAEDLSEEFRSYRDRLTYEPERLETVEERLALLYRLKKKYGADEDAILAYMDKAEAEIETLKGSSENQEKLKGEITALEREIASRAAVLSGKRAEAAKRLGEGITEILFHLGMPYARFSVAVMPKGQGSGGLVCGPWGGDDVEFLISANAGEPLKELARIASGGELSRVMLAIKTVLSRGNASGVSDSPETLVFDEIDTGIGGEVALAVGEYLAKIGVSKQIFCVTHLASIAARADNHLKVEKLSYPEKDGEKAGRTVTSVSWLSQEERRNEIARMLAGDSGAAALAHADELLGKYGKYVPR